MDVSQLQNTEIMQQFIKAHQLRSADAGNLKRTQINITYNYVHLYNKAGTVKITLRFGSIMYFLIYRHKMFFNITNTETHTKMHPHLSELQREIHSYRCKGHPPDTTHEHQTSRRVVLPLVPRSWRAT